MLEQKSVIQMHATWLAVNSIIGCTNGCKYCFLQSTNRNICKPKILKNSKLAIDDLAKSKYYLKNIPVCLLPNTDAFLNKSNIQYLEELINEIEKRKLYNPIIIITKCLIPTKFIRILKDFINKGHEVVIYLSLSGLPEYLEPNVNHNAIKQNFINLKENKIKVIHYYRPITPLNSDKKQIEEMINFVSKYAIATVIGGLKIKEDYFNMINFWPNIISKKEKCLKSDAIWPQKAYDYFYKEYNKKYSIYQTNYCALMKALNKPAIPYYLLKECSNCNLCLEKQRKKCKEELKKHYKETDITKVKLYLNKLGYNIKNIDIKIEKNVIKLNNIKLNIEDISFLTYALNSKIIVENIYNGNYWNSALAGNLPLVI